VSENQLLLTRLAEQLEAAAGTIRELAAVGLDTEVEPVQENVHLAGIDTIEWLEAAIDLHAQLGERQTQVLLEVIKAYPSGIGTGPIWKAIDYEQTNTYLALDALARQGLVRKDDTVRPHKYYVGKALIAEMRRRFGVHGRK
jgi:hypothetical protein